MRSCGWLASHSAQYAVCAGSSLCREMQRATTRDATGNNAGCNSLNSVAQHGERATDSVAFDRFDVLPLLGTLLADADAIARHAHKALQGYINAAIAARYLDTTRHDMTGGVGP